MAGSIIPFGSIPDQKTFPDGIYRLRVEAVTPTLTKEREGRAQKLMFKLDATVVEPPMFAGQHYFDQFCIGTEDDPDAEDLKTWQTSIGARQFKRFVKACGVPLGEEEDREAFCASLRGAEFLATIVEKTEPKTRKVGGVEVENPYAGQVRNAVTGWWKLGERTAGLQNGHQAKPATTPAAGDAITCPACRERVPKKDLKGHVEAHLAEGSSAELDE